MRRSNRGSGSRPTSPGPNQQRLERVEPRFPELAIVLEPPGCLPQRLGPEPEPVLAAADAAANQSRALQHLQVLRDRIEGNREPARAAADVALTPRPDAENGAAGRVGDGRVHPVQLRTGRPWGGLRALAAGPIIIQPHGRIVSLRFGVFCHHTITGWTRSSV